MQGDAMSGDTRSAPSGTEREAKEYLAERIAAEAAREGKPLTEIERKMLYFTETGWTLPDMIQVNAEFERRDYDYDTYERKILGLAREIEKPSASPFRARRSKLRLVVSTSRSSAANTSRCARSNPRLP
jgi:hypothetical protein